MKDLRTLIGKINDLSDLTKVLNYFKQCETNCEEHLFTEDVLESYSDPSKKVARRYKTFYIPKKNGKLREISAPNRNLKEILYYLNMMLAEVYQAGPSTMGFVKGRSIVDNANLHVGQNYVLNLDLSDFFTSISQSRICKRLQLAPFNFNENVAKAISGLCCKKVVKDGKKGYALPQGAPTSPILTNAVCDFLDKKLRHLSTRNGVKYSRYADDMTFSSMHNVYQENSTFMKNLFSIIKEERFTVNPDKTRLQKRGERQEVTGLTVNDKVNTAHKYTRELRNVLYMWEKYGYKDTYTSFYKHYKATKGHIKKGEPVLENVIIGKLDFLKMVKGENDVVYTKLRSCFEALNPNIYDSKNTNAGSKVNYIESYSVVEFEKAFKTKIKFIMSGEGKLSAVYKNGKKENSIYVSNAVKDIVFTEKAKPRKNYRFTISSMESFFVALCRSNCVNYWMMLANEPARERHIHPKYNNLPIDQLLKEWEEKGLEAAADILSSILADETISPIGNRKEPALPKLGKKKRKKKSSIGVLEELMIEDYMDDMEQQASLIDFEDEETIEYNTKAIMKLLKGIKMAKKNNSQKLISTLLANKKLTNAQREKIATLMIRDLDLANTNQDGESNGDFPKSDLPEYRSAKDVMDFLLEYNQDPILKYTCHPIDDMSVINEIAEQCENKVYSVKSHYHLILSRFTQLREKYRTTGKYLDGKVVSLMRVYITGETFHREPVAWSTQSITYNWHSPELWEWSNKNPGIVPNPGENIAEFLCNEGYKLPKPFISNLSGKRINTFGDLVMYYKSLLHIKRDDNLQNKILYVYKKGYQTGDQNSHPWIDRVDLTIGEFDNNIELFTSVDKLLQAFGAILSICIENQVEGKPLVEVGFYRELESKRKCFYVHHKNSQYRKGIEDSINKIGEKQTLLIKNQINGICDLYIQADFGNNQYAEINLWDGKPRAETSIDKTEGVKYILKY